MRAVRLEATGFRNLLRADLRLPAGGAVLLGPNGQGKTNLLEALYYPVLFRSLRGARDLDLVQFDEPGFHLRLEVSRHDDPSLRSVEAGFVTSGRRKRIALDGAVPPRVLEALGVWLAVAFLPSDVTLISGGASERRQFLDRVLSLSSPRYLRSLRAYRAAMDQRNAALRRGEGDIAGAFDPQLAAHGSVVIGERLEWLERYRTRWSEACDALGESEPVAMRYRGRTELAETTAWESALATTRARDLATGVTNVGPHRDDLLFELDESPLRTVGSTGQQRTAAIALKLCERDTLEAAHGDPPALLLDDVFAELDRARQDRLAEQLGIGGGGRQVFVTAPRRDELPPSLDLPVLHVAGGGVTGPAESVAA